MFKISVYFVVFITFFYHTALAHLDNRRNELVSLTRQPKLHPEFQRMLNTNAQNKRVNAWIFFTDKGIFTESELQLAINKHEACVNAKANIRRRQRAKHGIIHFTDLPVYQQYINDTLRIGGTQRCVSRWLNGISIEISLKELQQMQQLPFVKAIDPVIEYKNIEILSQPVFQAPLNVEHPDFIGAPHQKTQLSQIAVDKLHAMGYHGEGIFIGLLDTGFNLSHEAIKDTNVIAEWDFINNDGNTADEPDQDDKGQDKHGSTVLSVISGNSPGRLLGSAYEAGFLLGKTEKITANGIIFEKRVEEDWWIAGLEWMERLGVDVVNSSVGYKDWYRFADLDGKTANVTIAADLAVDKGVTMVIAAGNGGGQPLGDLGLPGRINAPADGFKVLAVGAVDADGRAANFSAHGPTFDGRIKPDVAAMGVDVTAIKPGTRDKFVSHESGTSVSSVLVAGAAALLLQAFPQATPDDISHALKSTASLAMNPNNTLGWGIVNVEAAYNVLLKSFAAIQITVESRPHALTSWGAVKHPHHQSLEQNYPNPFNSETWIPFRLTFPANVTISIYDLKGNLVKQLNLGWLPPGNYLDKHNAVYWNGLNKDAEPVSSSVYFYTIEAGNFVATRKMVIVE